MKKLRVLFVSVLLIANLFTAVAKKQQRAPYMTRTFPASSIKSLEVSTSGGSITVNGNAGSEAVVEVYVNRNGRLNKQMKRMNEQIIQVLEENYAIELKVEDGKLYVAAKQKGMFADWESQGFIISFRINAPKQVDSNLQTSGGSLTVENVSGNIVGKTSGARIIAKNCDGKIDITTSGACLKMSNLNGSINAVTSGARVTASNINGVIKTETSGADMKLDNISGSVDAKISVGSMNVTMKSVSDYVKLSNNGNINLTVPANKGYNLKIKANEIATSGLKNFNGNMDNGTVGNGGAEIEIKESLRAYLAFK